MSATFTRGPRPQDPYISPDELSSGPYKFAGGSRFDQINQLNLIKEGFVNNVIAQRLNSPVNPLKLDKRPSKKRGSIWAAKLWRWGWSIWKAHAAMAFWVRQRLLGYAAIVLVE